MFQSLIRDDADSDDLADQVARAWELRLAGASYCDIHDELPLYRSTKCYSTFFDNVLYAGVLDYGGQRYPERWQEGERFCEPYVTLDQFEQVQERSRAFAEKRHLGPYQTPRNKASHFLLPGLVICGHCLQERGEEVSLIGWTDPRRASGNCYRCGRKVCLRGASCQLRYVSARLLEQTVIECLRDTIFTPEYIRSEVAQANALLAQHSSYHERSLRRAQEREAAARRALENLGSFIATHGANAVIEEQYRAADRNWRSATSALSEAKAQSRMAWPLRITEAEAHAYARNLVAHMYDEHRDSRRRFLSTLIRRIVLFDEDGTIELADQPVYGALEAVSTSARPPKRGRLRNQLSDSSPSEIPVMSTSLEAAKFCWTPSSWGQASTSDARSIECLSRAAPSLPLREAFLAVALQSAAWSAPEGDAS